MKKLVSGVLAASALFTVSAKAEMMTATSAVYALAMSSDLVRLEQYFYDTKLPLFYGKVGVAKETPRTGESDVFTQDLTSVVFGVGVNALDYKNFFIDTSLDFFTAVDGGDYKGKAVSNLPGYTYVNDPNFNSAALEVGMGYSFGKFSVRVDYTYVLVNPQWQIQHNTTKDIITKDAASDWSGGRSYAGLGVAYWW